MEVQFVRWLVLTLAAKQAILAAVVFVSLAVLGCFVAFVAFIATMRPPIPLEGTLDFSLPGDVENAPASANPAEVTVIVKTAKTGKNDGNIESLIVRSSQGDKHVPDLAALEVYLKSIRANIKNQSDLMIEADSKVRYAGLMEVMDAAIRAGFERVGFNPPPDSARE
jgi:biopolymer transport protein ExbD